MTFWICVLGSIGCLIGIALALFWMRECRRLNEDIDALNAWTDRLGELK